jgi:putative Mn2+ efflux pump MntP
LTQQKKPTVSEATHFARLASLAVTIPAVLVLSPLVGWFLGRSVGRFLGDARIGRIGSLVGVALGVAAGIMQTIDLIRRISKELK